MFTKSRALERSSCFLPFLLRPAKPERNQKTVRKSKKAHVILHPPA